MPLEPQFRKPIQAKWSFKVLDMNRRLVAFQDESEGTITSWRWDFGDGTGLLRMPVPSSTVHMIRASTSLYSTSNVPEANRGYRRSGTSVCDNATIQDRSTKAAMSPETSWTRYTSARRESAMLRVANRPGGHTNADI